MEENRIQTKCTCPPNCQSVWDADPDCPVCGPAVQAEQQREQESEIWAENAWLRHAERPADDGFDQWEAERGLI